MTRTDIFEILRHTEFPEKKRLYSCSAHVFGPVRVFGKFGLRSTEFCELWKLRSYYTDVAVALVYKHKIVIFPIGYYSVTICQHVQKFGKFLCERYELDPYAYEIHRMYLPASISKREAKKLVSSDFEYKLG